MGNRQLSTAQKIQALTLVEFGGKSLREAERISKVSARQIKRYQEKARSLGFNVVDNPVLKDEYVAEAPRKGRPKVCAEEKDGHVQ